MRCEMDSDYQLNSTNKGATGAMTLTLGLPGTNSNYMPAPGSTDLTAAFNKAMNDANVNGQLNLPVFDLLILPGKFTQTGKLIVQNDDMKVKGSGRGVTIIQPVAGMSGDFLTFVSGQDPDKLEITDLSDRKSVV